MWALYLETVAIVTDIGSLIYQRRGVHGGRPCISSTSVSVLRIAVWHNMGLVPEEIVANSATCHWRRFMAALAYYHANKAEIDADLEPDEHSYDALAEQHRR